MAKLRVGQKMNRVVRFMMGLRNRRIASIMMRHGLKQENFKDGLTRLEAVIGDKLNVTIDVPRDDEALDKLDLWENKWFPIVKATLRHHYRTIHDKVFLNLSQTDGPEVLFSVGTLITRIDKINVEDDGTAARELLIERGLTQAVIDEAKALIEQAGGIEDDLLDLDAEEQEDQAQEQAEVAMWDWYLEWSTIARAVIKNGNLLRQLGFRK